MVMVHSIVIDPSTNNQYARVQLVDDAPNINKVVHNNRWKLEQNRDNPLYNRYLLYPLHIPVQTSTNLTYFLKGSYIDFRC